MLVRGSRRRISLERTPTVELQPLAQPGQMESLKLISHTRARKRKSLLVNAPTGHISMTFMEYGLSNSVPGNVSIVTWSPRCTKDRTGWSATSSAKRIQREQDM